MNCQASPELRAVHATITSVPVSGSTIRRKCLTRHPMHGFSLLELMAVVSIMVIMAAMALPSILSTLHYRTLQNTLLSSAGAIQRARFQALSTGIPYEITFNSSASTYQILACSNCSTIYDPNSTYTYGPAPAPLNAVVPFSAVGGPTLGASQSIYFRPGGAVQSTWGTTNCAIPISMTFTYLGVSKTLSAECYGNVTVPQ